MALGDIDLSRVRAAAARLLDAEKMVRTCPAPSAEWEGLDVRTAYAIQDEALRQRLARGEKLIGLKLGLTSRAKQLQMKVESPITAWLTDAMLLWENRLPPRRLIHPRAEPEIVFVMGRRLAGPGVGRGEALAAVASVRAGIEVLDSRYADFRFTLPDVVADNASSAGLILGDINLEPGKLDLASEQCALRINEETVAEARGDAAMGHPAQALANAVNELAGRGAAIEPGWIVMTGGLTDAVKIARGSTVLAEFTHLGRVSISRGE